jgi:hypothetical protein
MSFWDNFLCKVFGIRCPEKPEPPEKEYCVVCTDTGLEPNDTCTQVTAECKVGFCPVERCAVDHLYVEPPKIVTRTICVDSHLIRRHNCVDKKKLQFIKGVEPIEKCNILQHQFKTILTEYRMFENAKVWAAVTPGDLHDLNWRFHDKYTKANYIETANHLAYFKVNGKRHFFSCAEGEGDLRVYRVPFKKVGNKFNLWELDPVDWAEMMELLQIDLDRGLIPIMCIASGWKGARYEYTAWHPKNNVGVRVGDKIIQMHSDHRRLYTDPDSGRIYRGVAEMLVEALRDLKHPTGVKDPFVIEDVNEPYNPGDKATFQWKHALFSRLREKKKLDPTRMAFEKWNSRWIGVKKIDDKVDPGLQDIFPGIWCFYHGQTTYAQAVRWHKGEMKKIHNAYPGLCADSDGAEEDFPAQGLVGKNWNLGFRRITPVELKQFLIYDYKHNGAGYIHLSGVGWWNDDVCNYADVVKAFVKGLTKMELMEWQKMMKDYRGELLPVDWGLFSYEKEGKRYGLSEGKAIKQAMDEIHK